MYAYTLNRCDTSSGYCLLVRHVETSATTACCYITHQINVYSRYDTKHFLKSPIPVIKPVAPFAQNKKFLKSWYVLSHLLRATPKGKMQSSKTYIWGEVVRRRGEIASSHHQW